MATVVISPYRATKYLDRAGNFWVYLQYALGLQAIGCEVHWMERLERPGEGSRSGINASPVEQAAMLRDTLSRFGISNAPVLYTTPNENSEHFEPTYVGLDDREAEAVLRRAELLLNFHQRIHPELLERFSRTALVDIDPGLLQYWMSSGQLQVPDHDLYFTTGETVGTPSARFPDCGLRWLHIRPPVFLDQWPFTPGPPGPFTTVSSWYSSEYILEGDSYWDNNKRLAWLDFVELPKLTDQPLEIATYFGDKDASERFLLERQGWCVRHAGDVAGTPERYRSYIRSSRGEFSCAKPSCMRFENAWMSDRTLCYLASGRPAVVQDTGKSSYIPDGVGLHRISTPAEAAAAIDEVNAAYDRNSRAAREIAEAYFEATEVVGRIVEIALGERRTEVPAAV